MTHLLPTNLERLAKHTSAGAARYATGGIHVTLGDGTYQAESTDCSVLVRVTGPCEASETYPTIAGLETAPNGSTDAIIPDGLWSKAFMAARKLTKKRGVAPRLQHVAIKLGEHTATLASTDGAGQSVESGQHMEGRFPNCTAVIASLEPVRDEVWVDPIRLSDVLRTAADFSGDDKVSVVLETRGEHSPLTVRTSNKTGQKFLAVLMPMSRGDNQPAPVDRCQELTKRVQDLEQDKYQLERGIDRAELRATLAEQRVEALEREVAALRAAAPSLTSTVPAA